MTTIALSVLLSSSSSLRLDESQCKSVTAESEEKSLRAWPRQMATASFLYCTITESPNRMQKIFFQISNSWLWTRHMSHNRSYYMTRFGHTCRCFSASRLWKRGNSKQRFVETERERGWRNDPKVAGQYGRFCGFLSYIKLCWANSLLKTISNISLRDRAGSAL